MAEAGVTIYLNGGGEVQIDSNFKNLEMIGKYVIGMSNVDNIYRGSITLFGITPIIAFNSSSSYSALRSISVNGNNFTYDFVAAQPGNITVYLFDVPYTYGTSGLQIFDGAGNLTFDSNRRYMKIIADFTFNDYNTILGQPLYAPPGRVYAMLQNQFNGYQTGQYFTPGESGATQFQTETNSILYLMNGSAVIPNIFITSVNTAGLGLQQPYSVDRKSGQIQIVDVTGY